MNDYAARVTPPGWPRQVRPPGAPDWERTAVNWLFDLCPPEYRRHTTLRRHPVLLARMARQHVESAVQAARRGYSTARMELAERVPPQTVEELMRVYEHEGARLVSLTRQVQLVEDALNGVRWRPRL
ncbi:hypothetical protein [Allostreptomyces psammosilenae]|uniref:Uncharacterized protein n=1 Tax=Allostreptomyces psammosilenae TaxID=1892865 RepID=A0A852ZQT4_9ACTN|nr:hypothetical protein [Allostreptomyces psammosilenae]NYI03214.1 hypothetical protein [Allostreptomyces psammosilenae]